MEGQGSLSDYVSIALASDGYRTLVRAGGGILLMGFLLNMLLEWMKFYKGNKADWSGPIITVIITALSLALFPFIVQMVVSWIGNFGDLEDASKLASKAFGDRMDRFLSAHQSAASENSTLLERMTGLNDLKAGLLYWVTLLLKYVTLALVLSLKIIQGLLLKTLVFLGPIMISMGVLPGPFKKFPMNWFMLFFTLSFWSVVMNGMLKMLADSTKNINPSEINLSEEIILSFVWIFLILSVPVISSALIYGGGFSGVFNESVSSAFKSVRGKL